MSYGMQEMLNIHKLRETLKWISLKLLAALGLTLE